MVTEADQKILFDVDAKLKKKYPDIDYFSLWGDRSMLDGEYTADELRTIADLMDELAEKNVFGFLEEPEPT